MTSRIVVVFALTFLTAGCAASIAGNLRDYRADWVNNHGRDYPSEIQRAIIDGCVLDGMTVQQAEAAWDQHPLPASRIERTTFHGREVLRYSYPVIGPGSRWILVENGRVIASHSTVDPPYGCSRVARR